MRQKVVKFILFKFKDLIWSILVSISIEHIDKPKLDNTKMYIIH